MPFSGACLAMLVVPGVWGIAVSVAFAALAILSQCRKTGDRETDNGESENDAFDGHGQLGKVK